MRASMVLEVRLEDGNVARHTFDARMVGLADTAEVPMVVGQVYPGMQASRQGVQLGWTIAAVTGDAQTGDVARITAKSGPATVALPEGSVDADPTVVLDFQRPDGVVVKQTFTRRPFGFYMHKDSMPLAVEKVVPGMHAGNHGVQPGWYLTTVNGRSVETGTYADAMEIFAAAASALTGTLAPRKWTPKKQEQTGDAARVTAKSGPATVALPQESADADPTVVLDFRRPDGVVVKQTFTRQPFGFYMRMDSLPLAVEKVVPGMQAGNHGIQPGWYLTTVNGRSVEVGTNAEAMEIFQVAASTLPGSL